MIFFAGSCTTAHAVITLNEEDGGDRKFIMVQIPELTSEDSVAFRSGYKTVADIGKERIRRVIKKINEKNIGNLKHDDNSLTHSGHQNQNFTYGFRVYKYEKSGIRL